MGHQISHRLACCDAQMTQQMTKLLTFCIPTYKRPDTLRRCIDSIVAQIEKFKLSDTVDIYVTNDASPDDTANVLRAYESLSYFKGVTREKNLGMNVNIKSMLIEVAKSSDYQFIITDDDFIQPDILGETAAFLREQQNVPNRVAAIWTPRYSYTEDGELYCIVCNPFKDSSPVNPSASHAGKYMNNGFVLSGLILRAESIDFDFWEKYKENAYFPMIFFGELIYRSGAFYWNKNLVHHTVLNNCHWESWGRNELLIWMKKFVDIFNAYDIMSGKLNKSSETIWFKLSAFPSIFRILGVCLHSDELKKDKTEVLAAIYELKGQEIIKFKPYLSRLMFWALIVNSMQGISKFIVLRLLLLLTGKKAKGGHYRKRADAYLAFLRAIPLVFRIIY
jgi:glycosyltransferase involved in cell wall biosynthesis